MSFGKRGVAEPQRLTDRQPAEGHAERPPFRIPKLVRQLAKIAVTITFFVACFNFIPMLFYFVIEQRIGYSDSPSEFDLRVDSPGGYDAKDAALQQSCLTPRYRKTYPEFGASAAKKLITSKIRLTVESGTRYLACVMRTDAERYCEDHYRQRLAHNLAAYFEAKSSYLAFFDLIVARSGGRSKENIRETEAWKKYAAMITKVNVEDGGATYAVTPETHPELAAGISDLASRGLLRASDFGWFASPPAEIAALFPETPANGACP